MTGAPTAVRPPGYAAPLAACDEITVTVRDEPSVSAPHGQPPVARDRLAASAGDGVRVSGATRIPGGGPYLSGHFPEITIFPGVFILEAVAQAVALACGGPDGRPLRLHRIASLRFLSPLYPGDRLTFTATVTTPVNPDAAEAMLVTADCRRGDGARTATMTLEFRCWR